MAFSSSGFSKKSRNPELCMLTYEPLTSFLLTATAAGAASSSSYSSSSCSYKENNRNKPVLRAADPNSKPHP